MILGYYLSYNSEKYVIIYLIVSEICLIPLNASFLILSLGSLINN